VIEVARTVRELRPTIDLLARIRYLNQVDVLKDIGADEIFTDEDAVVSSVLKSVDRLFQTNHRDSSTKKDK
jgi:hypothetical protein